VKEIEALGGEAVANAGDVSDFADAKGLIDQAVDTFGGFDALVNNAGILRDRMLTNMTEEEWDSVIKVHLKGTFAPSHHAAAYWRDRAKAGLENRGRIINTSSVSGLYGNPGQTNYGAAKQGIAGFTYIASLELARYGVTVNAIAPVALTRLTEDLMTGEISDEMRDAMSPRWIASVCTWLVSEQSDGVTGRVFEASGRHLSIAEGWHRGPSASPVDEPAMVDEVVRDLLSRARPPARMDGSDGE
jgi:NAD(P)-dependent dehydrogenase (short-subunit alcohol dehydrogenase family)